MLPPERTSPNDSHIVSHTAPYNSTVSTYVDSSNVLPSTADSSHVLVTQAGESGGNKFLRACSKVICNKANVSNFLTFLIMVTGIVTVEVLEEDEIGEEVYIFLKLVRAFGLFGFAGGMTNWLAIRMMFDKIPFLVGSGVLLNNFIEIRENVKKTTMETYFDAGNLCVYVTQKTEIILNALQLEDSIRDIIRSPHVQAMIEDKIDEVFDTPEGFVLGIVVNKKKVKESIIPSLENVGTDIVPILSQLIRNSEHLSEENLREQINIMITQKMQDMEPKQVIEVVKDMVETELGWVIVWGNIFGGLLGVLLEMVAVFNTGED